MPSHPAPSISKSALLLSPCIAWAGPQAKWYDESLTSHEKQTDGTAFHKAAQCQVEGWPVGPVPERVTPWLVHSARYIQDDLRLRCELLLAEKAVGINWLTGESKPGIWPDRSYPRWPGWQFGTSDLVGITHTDELYVGDWKTGSTAGAREQLLSLAIALRPHYPKPDGSLREVITSCLEVNEYGVWPHEESPSEEELRSHADAMRFVWEDIGKRNNHVLGVHCTALY